METNIHQLVKKLESNYISGQTKTSKYVTYNLLDEIERIEAYDDSKHTSGETDSLGREKPFFNIVTSAKNIWFRATDLDRRHIQVSADSQKNYFASFVATKYLHQWMKESKFGQFLNKWGMVLAKYNEAVVKFAEQDGELKWRVVPWNTLIVDTLDFNNSPVIEVINAKPDVLRKNIAYDQDVVKALIDTVQSAEMVDGTDKEQKADTIKIYEIHGELPKSYITGDPEDSETYEQQMHVIASQESSEGEVDEFVLYADYEDQSPYMLTALLPEDDGRIALKGSIKHLFEAQWMANHSLKCIKDQLDLASKLIFQTSDPNFFGMNAVSALENGTILTYKLNQPLSQLENNSHDITSLQNQESLWKRQGNEIVGISESMQGAAPKSGTAWRQTEAVLQESHNLFNVMTQNKGLDLEDILRTFVIPFIKRKKLNNRKELVANLKDWGMDKIEAKYIKVATTKKVRENVKQSLLRGELPENLDPANAERQVREEMEDLGNVRFITPDELGEKEWKDIFKDLAWNIDIDITGEAQNARNNMSTLVTLMQNMIAEGDIKSAHRVRDSILEMSGAISPLELDSPEPVRSMGTGGQAQPMEVGQELQVN